MSKEFGGWQAREWRAGGEISEVIRGLVIGGDRRVSFMDERPVQSDTQALVI